MIAWDEERTTIPARGRSLRVAVTRPLAAGRHPAVLSLPGLGGHTRTKPLREASRFDGFARLLRAWSDAGFVTLRADPTGAGEGDGLAYAEADLTVDLDDHRASLEALRALPSVDPEAIFVFGHSLGGVLLPLVARGARGLVVHGAPSVRWSACLAAGARRQLALAGLAADEVERESALAARLYDRLLREGVDPSRILREDPAIAACVAARDVSPDHLHGRSLAYFRALDRVDPEAAWRAVSVPVLALQGEHDWVVADADHTRIASWIEGGLGESRTLRGLDHDLLRHASRAASFAARGRGETSEEPALTTLAWMRAELARASGFTPAISPGDTALAPERPA